MAATGIRTYRHPDISMSHVRDVFLYAGNLSAKASRFEDAIRLTVSYGGDTDTTGAITGSIAEVRFGIPDNIRQKAIAYLPDEMLDVINRFENKYSRHITR